MGIGIWISGKSTPNFEQYAAGTVRKTVFFNYFLPLIEEKNRAIMSIRKKLLFWRENSDDLGWWQTHQLDKLVIIYRVKNFSVNNKKSWQKLLEKVDVLPPSLVLAQAANESAWGTSRFATQGNNYFGQWCFEQGCGLVPQQRDSGKAHEVATFSSPKKSLGSYMQNLNSHPAYQTLRNIRTQLRINKQPVTGDALAAGLTSYSERGIEYIEELRAMIKFNKLGKHDQSINNSKTLL
ncbi:MAG: glucosaminidase domain-containing protein [Colwellia sp.]|nr:glucosaminidase domain-containing protein [Colwellia sp.]